MKKDDMAQFAALMQGVATLYGKAMSTTLTEIYWQALSEYSLAAVHDAIHRHVTHPDTGQFMPKPADLVKLIMGGSADQAYLAWSKVRRAIQTIGSYQSIVFDDANIHAVIHDMGGGG
jgi:hypothetical protein